MAKDQIDIAQVRNEVTRHAREILEHLYKVLLTTPPFTLRDGSNVVIEHYIPPEIGADGEATCAFDIRLPDGSHLEFTVTNTGWGRSFADALASKVTSSNGG